MTIEPCNMEDMFTGEEYFGKYLDMHEVYEKFVNLPHIYRVDYITYLGSFHAFKDISMETKMTPVGFASRLHRRRTPTTSLLFWTT